MACRPETKPVTTEDLLNPEDDREDDVAAHKAVEMAFPAHGNGDILDFMSKNVTAGNKRGYVSPKVKRLACETMAALGDDNTMKQYEDVLLKGPEEAGLDSTRKFIPEIAEIAGDVVEKVVPITDPLFPELFQFTYDSGASKHFCWKKDATKFLEYARNVQAINVGTASGPVHANQVLDITRTSRKSRIHLCMGTWLLALSDQQRYR